MLHPHLCNFKNTNIVNFLLHVAQVVWHLIKNIIIEIENNIFFIDFLRFIIFFEAYIKS